MSLPDHLDALEASGLIRLAQLEPDIEYLFRHGLVQDAAYESLLKRDRRVLHRAVGETLEQVYPDRLIMLAPQLATHFDEAGDQARALRYYTLAGDQAFRQFALMEAIAYYRRALDLDHRNPTSPMESLIHLYQRTGRSYELRGMYPEASALYEEMIDQGQQRGSQGMVLAALNAHALILSTPSLVHDTERGIATAERALALAEQSGDEAAAARALWTLLLGYGYGRGEVARGLEAAERSLEIAQRLGLEEQLAFTLTDMANIAVIAGRGFRAIELVEEAITLWRALNNPPMLAFSLNMAGLTCDLLNRVDDARRYAEEGLAICEAIDNDEGMAFSLFAIADADRARGDVTRAVEGYQLAAQKGAEGGSSVLRLVSLARAAWVYSTLVMCDQAGEIAAQIDIENTLRREPAAVQGEVISSLAAYELACHSPDAALALMGDIYDDPYVGVNGSVWLGPTLIELALAQGGAEEALHKADACIANAREIGGLWLLSEMLELRARTLALLDREDEAYAAYQESRETAESTGTVMVHWKVLVALADLEEARGSDEEAASLRRAARQILEDILNRNDEDIRAAIRALPEAASLLGESQE